MGVAQYMELDQMTTAQGWRLNATSVFSVSDLSVPWNLDRIDQVSAQLDGAYNTGTLDGSGSHSMQRVDIMHMIGTLTFVCYAWFVGCRSSM
jgi:hypothetical protein